jgi:hypothetical protein
MTGQFSIVRFAQGWRILFDGRWRGRFDYQVDAVEAALRLAGDVRRTGRDASILVQDRFGEMQLLAEPAEAQAVPKRERA